MKNTARKTLQRTYLKLIEKKPADKITVKDIAAESGLNRNTFYYHYRDVEALVEDIIRGQTDILISNYPETDSLRDSLDYAAKEAIKDRKTLLRIYDSSNRAIFENYLWQLCDRFVETYARKNSGEDRSYFVRYQKCFMFGLIIDWFNNEMPESFIDDIHKAFDNLKM